MADALGERNDLPVSATLPRMFLSGDVDGIGAMVQAINPASEARGEPNDGGGSPVKGAGAREALKCPYSSGWPRASRLLSRCCRSCGGAVLEVTCGARGRNSALRSRRWRASFCRAKGSTRNSKRISAPSSTRITRLRKSFLCPQLTTIPLARRSAGCWRPGHARAKLVVAGSASTAARRSINQLRGIAGAREDAEVFVFVDSDVCAGKSF